MNADYVSRKEVPSGISGGKVTKVDRVLNQKDVLDAGGSYW